MGDSGRGARLIEAIGKEMAAMARQMDGSEVFLLDKGGHPLMWTCPEEFRDAVLSFLKRKHRLGIREIK